MNATIASFLQVIPPVSSELTFSSCLPLKLYSHASLPRTMKPSPDWHTVADGNTPRIVKFMCLIEDILKFDSQPSMLVFRAFGSDLHW